MFKEHTMLKYILLIFVLTISFSDLKAQIDNSQKSISDSIDIVKTLMRKDGSVKHFLYLPFKAKAKLVSTYKAFLKNQF